jgi:hypothetical protein
MWSFRLLTSVGGLVVPGVAAAHGGEGAMFFAGEVLSLGLVALACLLARSAVITRAIAFLVGVLACMMAYGVALRTIPMRFGVLGSFMLGVLPALVSSAIVLVWGRRAANGR